MSGDIDTLSISPENNQPPPQLDLHLPDLFGSRDQLRTQPGAARPTTDTMGIWETLASYDAWENMDMIFLDSDLKRDQMT